jgi:hypothetical protein
MSAYQFDSKNVALVIGPVPMDDFGENKITITRTNDVSSVQSGLESNMFSVSNNAVGTISFELIYGTKYDTYMDNLLSFKKLIPIAFTDVKSLKSLVTQGMIGSQPDVVLGMEPDTRTWVLNVNSVDLSLKGAAGEFIGTVTPWVPVG